MNTPAQHNINDLDSAEIEQIQDLIAERKHSREQLSQLINLEISALAETMDKFLPGFWSRFLENRHQACQEFIQKKRNHQLQVALTADQSAQESTNTDDQQLS
ncbi:hypothetical protein [Crinalium epipsammum]|uniref:hypothetical protein n=1 Tax=Crinalium epipsammum TaxID=241425 RepID=UPI0002F83F84|nr:hypothetical protein [Crinalium epipsammum]